MITCYFRFCQNPDKLPPLLKSRYCSGMHSTIQSPASASHLHGNLPYKPLSILSRSIDWPDWRIIDLIHTCQSRRQPSVWHDLGLIKTGFDTSITTFSLKMEPFWFRFVWFHYCNTSIAARLFLLITTHFSLFWSLIHFPQPLKPSRGNMWLRSCQIPSKFKVQKVSMSTPWLHEDELTGQFIEPSMQSISCSPYKTNNRRLFYSFHKSFYLCTDCKL